jgi:drug/metabolite transporter (DMT)-like permease
MKSAAWVNLTVLVLVNILWAGQYPAYEMASNQMDVATLNFWVLLFALLSLLPFYLASKQRKGFGSLLQSGKSVRDFLLLGLLGIIPPSVLLAWGIAHSSAANAAILSLTIPVLMTGLGVIMLGERLTLIRAGSLLLGIIGILLVSTNDLAHASFDRKLLLGNAVIFLGGAGSAFYNTYSKEALTRYSELEVLIYSFSVAIVACAAISAWGEPKPFYQMAGYPVSTWVAVLFLGAIAWGLAMVLWMWVLNRLEVGQVSASIYLLPIFGLVLSVLTLHERITPKQILGGLLTFSGTAILMFVENRSHASEVAA